MGRKTTGHGPVYSAACAACLKDLLPEEREGEIALTEEEVGYLREKLKAPESRLEDRLHTIDVIIGAPVAKEGAKKVEK